MIKTKQQPLVSLLTLLTLATGAVLLLTSPAGAQQTESQGFGDVTEGHAFAEEIGWLSATGITAGCNPPANDRYCPDGEVSRAQMSAFLHRAYDHWTGGAAGVAAVAGFADVDSDHPFATDIAWMAGQGVTKGCNPPADDRFCPDQTVTRGQAAAFINRLLGIGTPASPVEFADVDSDHVFSDDIAAVAGLDITRGCGTDDAGEALFCPDQPMTRGQLAAFLYRTDRIAATYLGQVRIDPASTTLTGVEDAAISHTFTASGGQTPYNWASADLVAGLELDPDGTLTGTVAEAGEYVFSVTVEDAQGHSDTAHVDLVVHSKDLTILTTGLPDGVAAETPYDATLQAAGGVPPYTWQASGLPADLELDGAGHLSGTIAQRGTYPIAVTVTDSAGAEVDADFTLEVSAPEVCEAVTSVPDIECYSALQVYAAAFSRDISEATVPRDEDFCASFILCADGHIAGMIIPMGAAGPQEPGTLSPTVGNLPELEILMAVPLEAEVQGINPLDQSFDLDAMTKSDFEVEPYAQLASEERPVLVGSLPVELGQLDQLTVLVIFGQEIEGNLPPELAGLDSIEALVLADNLLEGPADVVATHLADTLLELDLSGNGCLTAEPSNAATLDELDGNWNDGCPTLPEVSEEDLLVGSAYAAELAVAGGHGPYEWVVDGNPTWLALDEDALADDDSRLVIPQSVVREVGEWEITFTVTDSGGASATTSLDLNVDAADGCEGNTTIPDLECFALSEMADDLGLDDEGWADGGDPCEWEGVVCLTGHVDTIFLIGEASGTIPAAVEHLSALRDLTMASGGIEGSLPPELGELTRLTSLDLKDNQLTGEVPASLANLTNLSILNLGTNQLDGAVPDIFADMDDLDWLILRHNELSGQLPDSIMDADPSNLYLQGNGCFTASTDLADWLGANHTGSGSWDDGCPTIDTASLEGGSVGEDYTAKLTASGGAGGPYAWELTEGPGWVDLDSDGELHTDLVETAGNLPIEVQVTDTDGVTGTADLILSVDPASGCEGNTTIPDLECYSLSEMAESLNFDDRGWADGTDPCGWQGVNCYEGHVNDINLLGNGGTIPAAVRHLKEARYFTIVSGDRRGFPPHEDSLPIEGSLPPELGEMSELILLELRYNQLTGQIPASLANLTNLDAIYLQDNYLDGVVPDIFGDMDLTWLQLHNNELSGPLPDSIMDADPLTPDLQGNGCFTASTDLANWLDANHTGSGSWDDGCS